jgi:hypothetical protein
MMAHDDEFLARYQHLRQVGLELNNRLVQTLPRRALDEGGKKLGILKKNTLILDSEDEIAVLMDYCLHDVRSHGLNAIERYLAESPPPDGSDEHIILEAKRRAHFTLVVVESAEPGVGVYARDLFCDEEIFLVDIGFSLTAAAGMILATRLMTADGITMTTGAALPVGRLSAAELSQFLERLETTAPVKDLHHLLPKQAGELSARIIRDCLKHGAAERISYFPADAPTSSDDMPKPLHRAPRIARNAPCPCGSGRKYKNCCAARR